MDLHMEYLGVRSYSACHISFVTVYAEIGHIMSGFFRSLVANSTLRYGYFYDRDHYCQNGNFYAYNMRGKMSTSKCKNYNNGRLS